MSNTKKSIVWAALSPLVTTSEDGIKTFGERSRKDLIDICYDALIDNGVDKLDIKQHLIPSYLQMARMEMLKGESAYKHHNGAKQVNIETDEPLIIIPEGSQWQAAREDTIEYFKNRQGATAFVGKNGGNSEWNVTKLAS